MDFLQFLFEVIDVLISGLSKLASHRADVNCSSEHKKRVKRVNWLAVHRGTDRREKAIRCPVIFDVNLGQ